MAIHTLLREQFIPRRTEDVFAFFADAANLEAITPSWLNFKILTPAPIAMRPGTLLDYRLKWHGIPIAWRTEIVSWDAPHSFIDVQIRGPYRLWHHVHEFRPEAGGTRMLDRVNYELPLGAIGELAHSLMVHRDLERVFDYRYAVIEKLFPAPAAARR